jgi:hypothetical protein
MSTPGEREVFLRQALLSAAEAIEPGADGLQRIQARLRPSPRPLPAAWADALWTELLLRAPAGLRSAGSRLAGGLRRGWDKVVPQPGTATGHGIWSLRLLRPLAAVTAVFIVAAGAYVAFDAPQSFFPNSSNSPVGTPGSPSGGGGGASGTSSTTGRSESPVSSPGTTQSSANPVNCSAAPVLQHPGSTPPFPAASSPAVSPSPPDSTSPSTSPSPSPTPSDSGGSTPDPGAASSSPPVPSSGGQPSTNPIAGDSSPAGTGISRKVKPSPSPSASCQNAAQGQRGQAKRVKKDKAHPLATISPDSVGAVELTALAGRLPG